MPMRALASSLCIAGLVGATAVTRPAAGQEARSPITAAVTVPRTSADAALLINSIERSETQLQLRSDLRDPSAAVRAVAARVAMVSIARSATATLMMALAAEQDVVAGAEMIRALLTVGGAPADAAVALAASRLGSLAALTLSLIHI